MSPRVARTSWTDSALTLVSCLSHGDETPFGRDWIQSHKGPPESRRLLAQDSMLGNRMLGERDAYEWFRLWLCLPEHRTCPADGYPLQMQVSPLSPFFLLSPPSSLPHEQEDQNSAPGKSRKERWCFLEFKHRLGRGSWGQDRNQSPQYGEQLRNNLVLQRDHREVEPVF